MRIFTLLLLSTPLMLWACDQSAPPPSLPTKLKTHVIELDAKTSITLVEIPAGTFTMGSPVSEAGRQSDERQHEVTISKPFLLATTPVTVDQFAVFVRNTKYKTEAEIDQWSYGFKIEDGQLVPATVNNCSWRSPSFSQSGDHPVIHVTWNDAKAFCEWLSENTGKKVTLPTEAQWEYAARAGSTAAYSWGDDPKAGRCNAADASLHKTLSGTNADWAPWDDAFAFTSPVQAFAPNAYGLYDMHGNVCQWCLDFYGDYPAGPVTDPAGPPNGSHHIQRGGSWYNPLSRSRSAFRRSCEPAKRYDDDGFRIAIITAD